MPVEVDGLLRTGVDSIHAIGDLVGGYLLGLIEVGALVAQVQSSRKSQSDKAKAKVKVTDKDKDKGKGGGNGNHGDGKGNGGNGQSSG